MVHLWHNRYGLIMQPQITATMTNETNDTFATTYPNIAHFVDAIGWIEIGYGHEGYLTSFIRALDEGGMIWEGADEYIGYKTPN